MPRKRIENTSRSRRKWTEEEIELLHSYTGHMPVKWIAQKLGRSWAAIHSKIQEEGLSSRLASDAVSLQTIAEIYGTPLSRLYKMANNGDFPKRKSRGGQIYLYPEDITLELEAKFKEPIKTWKRGQIAVPKTKNSRMIIEDKRIPIPSHADKTPWGRSLTFTQPKNTYTGKVFWMRRGHRMSLQIHTDKSETICLLTGIAQLNLAGNTFNMQQGVGYHIPKGVRHRLSAVSNCLLIEASTPEVGTTIRLEDDYGRGSEEFNPKVGA